MGIQKCYLCEKNSIERRRYGRSALADGENCPICHQPVCRYHLTTVRWRWRATGTVATALICKECRRTYAHRSWDEFKREWIT